MKTIILILVIIMMASCTIIVFDDINDFKGAVVLSTKVDSIGNTEVYNMVVSTKNNGYKNITLRPIYGKLFKKNNTI